MPAYTEYLTDPEEIRLVYADYPRLVPDQLLVTQPTGAIPAAIPARLPSVRGLIEAHEERQRPAMRVMVTFDIQHRKDEPRVLFEYYAEGDPDPQGIPPVFFSVGAREWGWVSLIVEAGGLGILDRLGSMRVMRLTPEQLGYLRVFLLYGTGWCLATGTDPERPYEGGS